jgi:hypothetical protein
MSRRQGCGCDRRVYLQLGTEPFSLFVALLHCKCVGMAQVLLALAQCLYRRFNIVAWVLRDGVILKACDEVPELRLAVYPAGQLLLFFDEVHHAVLDLVCQALVGAVLAQSRFSPAARWHGVPRSRVTGVQPHLQTVLGVATCGVGPLAVLRVAFEATEIRVPPRNELEARDVKNPFDVDEGVVERLSRLDAAAV